LAPCLQVPVQGLHCWRNPGLGRQVWPFSPGAVICPPVGMANALLRESVYDDSDRGVTTQCWKVSIDVTGNCKGPPLPLRPPTPLLARGIPRYSLPPPPARAGLLARGLQRATLPDSQPNKGGAYIRHRGLDPRSSSWTELRGEYEI